MEPDPGLLDLLPPSWLAFAHEWAPYVIGVLVLTTLAAHLLLPLARKLETWAETTSVEWDNAAARLLVVTLGWIVATSATLMEWLPRFTAGPHTASRSEGERGHPSEVGTRRPSRPPSDGALGLVLVVLTASLSAAVSGCSSGPQLPIVTVPMSISCSWHVPVGALPDRDASVQSPSGADATAGIVVTDNDCMIDRSSATADAETTGNRARDVRVDPTTSVSAIPAP